MKCVNNNGCRLTGKWKFPWGRRFTFMASAGNTLTLYNRLCDTSISWNCFEWLLLVSVPLHHSCLSLQLSPLLNALLHGLQSCFLAPLIAVLTHYVTRHVFRPEPPTVVTLLISKCQGTVKGLQTDLVKDHDAS